MTFLWMSDLFPFARASIMFFDALLIQNLSQVSLPMFRVVISDLYPVPSNIFQSNYAEYFCRCCTHSCVLGLP